MSRQRDAAGVKWGGNWGEISPYPADYDVWGSVVNSLSVFRDDEVLKRSDFFRPGLPRRKYPNSPTGATLP